MPDRSGPKPYRTTAEGMVHFVFPGGVRATVSNNLVVLLAVIILGFWGWSWVQSRLDQLWSTVEDVSTNKAAVEQLQVDVRIAKGEAEKRAMQDEVDELRATVAEQRDFIAELAECVRKRQRCTDLEVKDENDDGR